MSQHTSNMIPIQVSNYPPTIGDIVKADYRKAEIFRKYGIDYCCGGKQPLEETCQKKGIDPAVLQRELDAIDQLEAAPVDDVTGMTPAELAQYIVSTHHLYVQEALPMLDELTKKVARVHGERHPELIDIRRNYQAVAEELLSHMRKEELILFPYIQLMQRIQTDGSTMQPPPFGTIQNPIRMMEAEHTDAGDALVQIRTLSADYTPPVDACTSYRVLFAKLSEFERDLHRHVHLENNILFPAAIALEENLLQ